MSDQVHSVVGLTTLSLVDPGFDGHSSTKANGDVRTRGKSDSSAVTLTGHPRARTDVILSVPPTGTSKMLSWFAGVVVMGRSAHRAVAGWLLARGCSDPIAIRN